jgi:crotonobetainyl-CoA:carnitine CoA-transferase CaiB-like acyl-CoA transferase
MDTLAGVKVISFNHFLAGPAAAQLLGDLGADVVAIEPLEGAFQRNWAVAGHFVDGQSVNHLATGRSKRSIAVDMKSADGKALVERLVASADVVMENFRPGAMARLGFDPERLLADYPRLVYAAATGFGSTGPLAHRPGQDLLLQAMSGLAAHTGRADGPPVPVGSVVIDQHAAALYAMGIMAALLRRGRTGRGGRVDVSLLQAAIDLQAESITAWLNGAPHSSPRGPGGVATWFSAGGYGIHRTADGYLAISMSPPATLGKALGIADLEAMPESEAFRRREEITQFVSEKVATLTLQEAIAMLDAQGVWNARVESYDDLPGNPQVQHLQAVCTLEGATGAPVTLLSHPVRYDGATVPVARVPQPLGAQTREILGEVGFTAAEIEDLIARKVVVSAEMGA